MYSDCVGLKSVNIPNSVTSIEPSTFEGCSGLKSVAIGYNVTRLGNDAFGWCSSIEDVYCYTEWVPLVSGNPFTSSLFHTTLHVLETLIKNYDETEPWCNFGKIVALTEEEIEANGGTNPYAWEVATPNTEKTYSFQSKQNGYYMTLSADGISIAEEPCALKFEEAGDGKYYITDGEYYVGISGTDGWTMSSNPEKKETLTVSVTIIDGETYYSFNESLGMVGVDWPKKDNMGCWADKKTSDGDAVLWLVKEMEVVDAIADVKATEGDYQIYTIDGKAISTLQKGVNIIRYTNGKVKKVLIK